MKYAMVDGERKHINSVERGTIGQDCWFPQYQVKACKGHYMQYWKYIADTPILPEGYENETDWHAAWKNSLNDEYVEVVLGDNNEHRADIQTPERVIEIQKSPIPYDVARERSNFYFDLMGNIRIIWVINAYGAAIKGNITCFPDKDGQLRVDWKYKKRWACDISGLRKTDVYLDLSNKPEKRLLKIWQHNGDLYGKWVKKEWFYNDYLAPYSNKTYDEFSLPFAELNMDDYL